MTLPSHTDFATPDAVDNASADRRAARGRTSSSGATAGTPSSPGDAFLQAPRTHVGDSSTTTLPRGRILRPSHFAYHLVPTPHRQAFRVHHEHSHANTVVIPAGSSDIVGNNWHLRVSASGARRPQLGVTGLGAKWYKGSFFGEWGGCDLVSLVLVL